MLSIIVTSKVIYHGDPTLDKKLSDLYKTTIHSNIGDSSDQLLWLYRELIKSLYGELLSHMEQP